MTWVGLHGFAGSPRMFEVVEAKLGLLHAPWLAGHGPRPHDPGTFDEEADRLAEALHELPAPLRVVGYSLGARFALALLPRLADVLANVIVIGAELGLAPEEREARVRLDADRAERLRTDGIDAFMDVWEREPVFATQASLPADALVRRRAERRSHAPRPLASALERFSPGRMPDLRPTVAEARVPLTFVAGELDEKFAALAAEGARIAPHGRCVLVPRAGHDVLLEQPERAVGILFDGDSP